MAYTLSPNMLLRIPTVGNEVGPDYAIDINLDLASIIDAHDHTPGRGVQITPAGININTSLSLNGNFLTDIAGLTLSAQSTTPGLGTIYESGVDLYFVDGLGNNIRITQSGGIAGTPGSITNLTPPASVTYVSGSQTFVFESGVGIAANIDAGAYLFRNLTPNSTFAVTLQAPASLAANYALTLPSLPPANYFMALDQFGQMSTTVPVANGLTTANISGTANILGTQLSAAANILGTQLSASANILGSQLSPTANIVGTQLSATAAIQPGQIDAQPRRTLLVDITASGSVTIPAGVSIIFLEGSGGGEGGAAVQATGADAQGGFGAPWSTQTLVVTPGSNYTATIGAGGTGSTTTTKNAGAASTFGTTLGVLATFPGANSGTSTGQSGASPWFAAGTPNTFNPSVTANGGGGGGFGVGANGRAGANNFTGFSAAANTGAGGGGAHAQSGGATSGAGGSGRIKIYYYTLQV